MNDVWVCEEAQRVSGVRLACGLRGAIPQRPTYMPAVHNLLVHRLV